MPGGSSRTEPEVRYENGSLGYNNINSLNKNNKQRGTALGFQSSPYRITMDPVVRTIPGGSARRGLRAKCVGEMPHWRGRDLAGTVKDAEGEQIETEETGRKQDSSRGGCWSSLRIQMELCIFKVGLSIDFFELLSHATAMPLDSGSGSSQVPFVYAT